MADDLSHPDADDQRIEAILRSVTAQDQSLQQPPATVWAGIEAALEEGEPTATASDQMTAPVIDLTARRNRRLGFAAGAAAAAVALILGVVAVVDDGSTDYREVASADLSFAPEFDPGGEGRSAATTLLEADDAQRLRFDAADLPTPAAGEDVELWLIGLDGAGEIEIIQTLGVVEDLDEPGTFDVPADFSTDEYATVAVDLSFEPQDGVDTHSGRSILRGALGI